MGVSVRKQGREREHLVSPSKEYLLHTKVMQKGSRPTGVREMVRSMTSDLLKFIVSNLVRSHAMNTMS